MRAENDWLLEPGERILWRGRPRTDAGFCRVDDGADIHALMLCMAYGDEA